MFVIRMLDGEEIQACKGDELTVNPATGVLTVRRADRFGEVAMHYSATAWRSVTHRITGPAKD